jgi:hypothetical protein
MLNKLSSTLPLLVINFNAYYGPGGYVIGMIGAEIKVMLCCMRELIHICVQDNDLFV